VTTTIPEEIGPTTSAALATTEAEPRLRGNLGVFGLFFSVMAWNAPLVIVVGIIPVMLVIGNGVGTPIAFVAAGLIIGAFAVGFTRMARVLPNPGAFYAYITAGLGKAVGLGSGLLTLFGYFAAYVGTPAFGGVVLSALVEDTLNGPDLPWWLWGSLFFLIAGILGYLKVELSAKVLTTLLALELIVIVVYDVLVAVTQGVSALNVTPFNPGHWFDGSFGLALLFGLGMDGGFEITALVRDEVRDPQRTVPRATFAVIATAMCLYAVTAWLFVNSLGLDRAVAVASADPTGSMTGSMAAVGSKILADSATILVNTSTIAVVLAGHNIVARYVFNLSADRILPPVLSRVHPRHGSPHLASLATSLAAVAAAIPFVLADLDPIAVYAALLGVLSLIFIVVLFITNIAVPVYMRRRGGALFTLWGLVICPIVAAVGLGSGVVLAVLNFPLLIGGSTTLAAALMLVMLAIFSFGVGLAIVYRRTRPAVYAKIGRQ
jgi:amino acid transporter